jgi:hypothetical protein
MSTLPTTHGSGETIVVRGLSVQSLLIHASHDTHLVAQEHVYIERQ